MFRWLDGWCVCLEQTNVFWHMMLCLLDGWKGLTFIGKSNGILTNATRKHSDALSVVEYLSLPKEDLLAYEFRTGEVFRPSYFIARDRATNSIVLSIRGTMASVWQYVVYLITHSWLIRSRLLLTSECIWHAYRSCVWIWAMERWTCSQGHEGKNCPHIWGPERSQLDRLFLITI